MAAGYSRTMGAEVNARERLSLADVARRTAVIVAVVGGSLLLAVVVYDLRTILVWLLIAGMFALTVAPAVAWLEKRRVPRWLGAGLVTLAAALALGVLVVAVAVPLVSQSRELLGNLPHLAHDLFKPGGPLAFVDQRFHVERRIGVVTPARLLDLVAGPRSLVSLFTRTAAAVAAAVTIITITVMLLVEGPRAWRAFIESLGASRQRLGEVADRMQRSVAGYVRGNLLVSLLAGAGAFVAMSILHAPYALPLAVAVGLLDLVPLVGAIGCRAVRAGGPVGRLARGRHPHRLLRRLPADREPCPGAGDLRAYRGDVAADGPAGLARRRRARRARRRAHRDSSGQRRGDRRG